MSLRLQNGALSLHLSPENGGSVLSFQHNERNILRPAPANIPTNWKATSLAAFPMIPFCGRIYNGRLKANGRTIQLPANMPPEPHTIHGFGWQSEWNVQENTSTRAILVHTSNDAIWPWVYTAIQEFELIGDTLKVSLQITNNGNTSMPTGFGWHPYYPRKNAHLTAPTIRTWSPGNDTTPARPTDLDPSLDLSGGCKVAGLNVDHAFDVTEPQHTIRYPDMTIDVTADPVFGKMIAYVPDGEDYFCVETISHAPGTLDSTLPDTVTGVHHLSPGESLSGTITMRVITDA